MNLALPSGCLALHGCWEAVTGVREVLAVLEVVVVGGAGELLQVRVVVGRGRGRGLVVRLGLSVLLGGPEVPRDGRVRPEVWGGPAHVEQGHEEKQLDCHDDRL